MNREEKKQFILENLIYVTGWLLVLALPVFRTGLQGERDWGMITHMWWETLPFFILFLIHNYWLVPYFLIRKKGWKYATGIALLLLLFATMPFMDRQERLFRTEPFMEQRHRFPPQDGRRLPFHREHDRDRRFEPRDGFLPRLMPPGRLMFLTNRLLIAILMLGFNIAIKFVFKTIRDDRRMRELEKHTLETELNYLKMQINPHFFMNTLNNIHALIDMDTEKAKETVIELSKMMRYVLYGANQTKVPLGKEVQFIENYIALMRIRYTEEVDIRLQLPAHMPEANVPPMLLIASIENAFKHGVSYRHKSYIHTQLSVADGRLNCFVVNSLSPSATPPKPGMGLENLKKRLFLLYGNNYSLDIWQDDERYRVSLIIPLES
ncbi:MAG: histidine kinase [Tannerella sp.]|jgi:hypothetical protein|nr:histidine kinase [Tannerella sp.]